MSEPTGRVVAELGRPETADETAARKARDRRLRRSRQTFRNLIASLAVCVGLVVVIVLAVPRGSVDQPAIDVRAAALQYGDTAGQPLLAPTLPTSWKANAAQLRGSTDTAAWYVGYVIDGTGFAAFSEGLPGSNALLSNVLDGASATDTTTIGGLPWRVYDRRHLGSDAGNVSYGLATKIGKVDIAVYGTAMTQVEALATAVAKDAGPRGLTGTAVLP